MFAEGELEDWVRPYMFDDDDADLVPTMQSPKDAYDDSGYYNNGFVLPVEEDTNTVTTRSNDDDRGWLETTRL